MLLVNGIIIWTSQLPFALNLYILKYYDSSLEALTHSLSLLSLCSRKDLLLPYYLKSHPLVSMFVSLAWAYSISIYSFPGNLTWDSAKKNIA